MLSEPPKTKLNSLASEIITESNKFNLTGYSDTNKFFNEQIDDCIKAYTVCEKLLGKRVIDVGSGAGIPGLVWAIISDNEVWSIDSNRKKVKFQNEFIAEHEVSNATAEHNRIENIKMFATDSFCLLYTSPSPRDATLSRMPSSA